MSRKRARIEDVISLTGLSRSTIDRVLNLRPGVKAETKRRVEKALEELGYSASALAVLQNAQPAVLEVLVSRGSNPFFEPLEKGLVAASERAEAKGARVIIGGFDPYRPETVVRRLRRVSDETTAVVTVGVDTSEVEAEINRLVDRGTRVVTLISDVPRSKRHAFVGQDNFAAGRTAGRLMLNMLPEKSGEIAVLLGHLQFRHLLDRQAGFQQVVGLARPALNLISTAPYGTDREKAAEIVGTLVKSHPNLVGVYLAGGGQPYLIEALTTAVSAGTVVISHELTRHTHKALEKGLLTAILAHDVLEIGTKAISAALDADDTGDPACKIDVFVAENLPKGFL